MSWFNEKQNKNYADNRTTIIVSSRVIQETQGKWKCFIVWPAGGTSHSGYRKQQVLRGELEKPLGTDYSFIYSARIKWSGLFQKHKK